MEGNKISVEVKVNKTVDVEIELMDVIDSINQLPIAARWNIIGNILNELELTVDDLTDGQKTIVVKYLTNKLELFKPSK